MKSSTADPAFTISITRRGFFNFRANSSRLRAPITLVPLASLSKN